MPKRLSAIFAMLCALAVFLVACGTAPSSIATTGDKQPLLSAADTTTEGAEIALLLSDAQKHSSRGSEVLNTVSTFGGEEGITTGTYIVNPEDTQAALATLGLAVKGNARIVIAMGNEMAETVRRARTEYPELYFILLDAEDAPVLTGNVVVLHHSQVQAGWLAGYAAVIQGARQLAVFEAESEQAQARALGFALGAEAAGAQLKLEDGDIELQPIHLEDVQSITARRSVLRDLYAQGTGLVFINDPTYQSDTLAAAQGAEGSAVGVELGYIRESAGEIASVERSVGGSLYLLLQAWAEDSFPEEGSYTCGIANRGWTFNSNGFAHFTEAVYTRLVESFTATARAGSLERMVQEDGILRDFEQLPLARVRIVEMEIAEEGGVYLPRRVIDPEAENPAAYTPNSSMPEETDSSMPEEETSGAPPEDTESSSTPESGTDETGSSEPADADEDDGPESSAESH